MQQEAMKAHWTAVLHAPLATFGVASIATGLCIMQVFDPFVGGFAMVASLGAVVLVSWFLARSVLPLPYAWCWVVGGISVISGIALGRSYFDRLLLDQIPKLEAELQRNPKVPNLFDVESSPYFRRVVVSPGPGTGIHARFGMPDGTVLVHVSDAAYWPKEATRPCSKEVRLGWYRRWRC